LIRDQDQKRELVPSALLVQGRISSSIRRDNKAVLHDCTEIPVGFRLAYCTVYCLVAELVVQLYRMLGLRVGMAAAEPLRSPYAYFSAFLLRPTKIFDGGQSLVEYQVPVLVEGGGGCEGGGSEESSKDTSSQPK
jgi:hypothetical protein